MIFHSALIALLVVLPSSLAMALIGAALRPRPVSEADNDRWGWRR
jgi:hypothetical protein